LHAQVDDDNHDDADNDGYQQASRHWKSSTQMVESCSVSVLWHSQAISFMYGNF
jgi:hypothetical protein